METTVFAFGAGGFCKLTHSPRGQAPACVSVNTYKHARAWVLVCVTENSPKAISPKLIY